MGPRFLHVNYLQFITDPTTEHHSFICLASLVMWVCGFCSKLEHHSSSAAQNPAGQAKGPLFGGRANTPTSRWHTSLIKTIPEKLSQTHSTFPPFISIYVNVVLPHSSLNHEAFSIGPNLKEVLPSLMFYNI